jgi:hypothetical protein
MINLLMLAGLIVGLVVFWQIFTSKSKAEESGNTETRVREPVEYEIELSKLSMVEVETEERMEKRLKKMKNPDEGKPFAKISTPDVSELPSEEVTKPKKKKRYYKKRAPKKPGSDNASA